jgi:hypothetical protein
MNRSVALPLGGVGCELEHVLLDGIPSGDATCTVYKGRDSRTEDPVLSGSATIEPVTGLSLSAASGYSEPNRARLNVEDSDLAIGRLYRVTNVAGQSEVFRAVAVTPDYVLTEHELAYDYDDTAEIDALRISFAVDAEWLADEENLSAKGSPYRVLWTYEVAGEERRAWTYFEVVVAPAPNSVGEDDVFDWAPDLVHQMDADKRVRLMRAAHDTLRVECQVRGMDYQKVAASDLREDLVRRAALMIAAQQGVVPPGREPETYVRERTRAFLAGLEVALAHLEKIDNRASGALTDEPALLGFVS